MTPFRFWLARTLRDERTLQTLSVTQDALLSNLTGKNVALVGNARALADGQFGPQIDAADVVVRINAAPMPAAISHGIRTDWLGLAVRLKHANDARLAGARILWMSPKRKRLSWRIASRPGFYLHPIQQYDALKSELNAPPTTGCMLVALLLRSQLRGLTLYGFDFFASQSLSGRRTAAQVPHDFGAESRWIDHRLAADKRLQLLRPRHAEG